MGCLPMSLILRAIGSVFINGLGIPRPEQLNGLFLMSSLNGRKSHYDGRDILMVCM
jgi:hypothetical protein